MDQSLNEQGVALARSTCEPFSMNRIEIILASASPRRRDYLCRALLDVQVKPVDIDESPREGESGESLVTRLAHQKAMAIEGVEVPVVAGDTIVCHRGEILGKPANSQHAREMLELLSGSEHQVISGWCGRLADSVLQGVETTQVRFRELDREQIEKYIATGEPLDKAGAYGIQGLGGALVESVQGSWSNVVGLPLIPVLSAVRRILGR